MHYEVIVNGKKVNSQKLKLPSGKTLKGEETKHFEIDRIKLIVLASSILIIFWASFEQAGGLLNIYAFEKTDRFINSINFEVPASWFQSINPLLIIVLGYSVSVFWMFLKKKQFFIMQK